MAKTNQDKLKELLGKIAVSTNTITVEDDINHYTILELINALRSNVKELDKIVRELDEATDQETILKLMKRLNGVVNIEEYADKVVKGDWTPAIQQAINDGVKTLVFDSGKDYLVNPTGKDWSGRLCAVNVAGKSGLTIKGENGSTIVFDYSQEKLPNLFSFTNCDGILIDGLHFKGINTRSSSTPRYDLYTGAGIYSHTSKNITLRNCEAYNCGYLACLHDTDNSRVIDCTFKHDYYRSEWSNRMDKPSSAILLYSCKDCLVDSNVIYGGCTDGDLSIFGGRTERCTISKNKLIGYGWNDTTKKIYFANQGITYDQGPRNCIVSENIVHGYYYGIDLKADTKNCQCINNIIENCKVGIADRQGESAHVGLTQFNSIRGNKILLGNNHLGSTEIYGYSTIGIMLEARQGCQLVNNEVQQSFYLTVPFGKACGIYIEGINTLPNNSLQPMIITNNLISFTVTDNSTTYNTPVNSVMMHGKYLRSFILNENGFKGNDANTTYVGLLLDTKAVNGFIYYNQFFGASNLGINKTDGINMVNVTSNLTI